jgi:hypothetical protein
MIRRRTGDSSSLWATVKPSAVANLSAVLFGIAVWLALSLGSLCAQGATVQQSGADTDVEKSSGAPAITANPRRVTVAGGVGRTEISWDTGSESMGFVFVTTSEGKPVLFATGAKGSRVAPWIQPGTYAFELYGDDQRRTLLAAVTVSGTTESEASPRTMLLQGKARWLLIVALMVVIYIAFYLSSTGTLRTTFPVEPTTSPRPLHVGRNLFLGVAAFICLDGIIFHTRLYVSILAPDSYAGGLAVLTRVEKQRPPSGLKEVLVLGDSRIAEGFSVTVADELGSKAGLKFVNLAEPYSSVDTWYYMLREVDPTAQRYAMIVVPYGVGYEPNRAEPLRISMVAPLLRYTDCFNFGSGFQRWSGRFKAFTACVLRGSAYQSDVTDLLEHPIARMRSIQDEPKGIAARAAYKGRNYDLVGTTYDPRTGQITFPPHLTEAQRQRLRESLIQPPESERQYLLKLQRYWMPRILNRYSNSPTAIVVTPVPRGPFGELTGFAMPKDAVFTAATTKRTIVSVPAQTFDFLETPQYYFDGYHLNAKGRQRFTETLVNELVGHLGSADSKPHFSAEFQLAADHYFRGNDVN